MTNSAEETPSGSSGNFRLIAFKLMCLKFRHTIHCHYREGSTDRPAHAHQVQAIQSVASARHPITRPREALSLATTTYLFIQREIEVVVRPRTLTDNQTFNLNSILIHCKVITDGGGGGGGGGERESYNDVRVLTQVSSHTQPPSVGGGGGGGT